MERYFPNPDMELLTTLYAGHRASGFARIG
jgi:hypothetical protein